MGLLDDAIREHLELKRRRGGDPTEIERLEQEALGPVRRVPESAEATLEPGDHVLEHSEPAIAYEDDHPLAFTDDYEEPAEEVGWESEEPHAAPPPPPPPPQPAAAPPPQATPAQEPSEVGGETIEYDVEAEHGAGSERAAGVEHAAAESPTGEDVLEETPEFLQDTPDHDRLWFEQRPPRDFDFDG